MQDTPPVRSSTRDILLGARPSGRGPIRFSINDAPERERPGIYRDFIGRSVCGFDVEPLRDVPFEVDVTVELLPGVQILSGKVYGSCNQRTRQMLADGIDDVTLMVNLGGPYLVSHGGNEIVLADGDATLVSLADIFSLTHRPPGDVLALRIPRVRLAALTGQLENCCFRHIPGDTQALRLLTAYIRIASHQQTSAGRELQHAVACHIQDLVAVTVGMTGDAAERARGRGVRAARLHAIKQDIVGSLGQANLSVTALAARHGCTPRFIQRLFETSGTTFTDFVLAQRLARAYRLLGDPGRAGEKIVTIAYDAGFGDLSYFNRVFRRQYGVAPSDVRAHARRNPVRERHVGDGCFGS